LSFLKGEMWRLREDDYEPALEHELESRFSLSNGSLGIRGSLDIAGAGSRPRSYVAGLFDSRPGPPAVRSLVPAPQAFPLRVAIDGEQLDISLGRVKQHVRLLDYGSACLRSFWAHELASGKRISLDSLRFVSRADPLLAFQLLRFDFEQHVLVALHLEADGDTALVPAEMRAVWRTNDGLLSLARHQAYKVQVDGGDPSGWESGTPAELRLSCEKSLSLLQITGYGLDPSADASRERARRAVTRAARLGPRRAYERHSMRWQERWRRSDVQVEGDEEAQRALRFAVYHLNSAVAPSDRQASIGARALTGDAYMGHVFWDTDVFMLPFYAFTWPAAARSLLAYRYRTLDAARTKARTLGFQGALFAWESTDSGEEATPPYVVGPQGEVIAIRSGDLEHHVSAAVAYGVWQYWQATHDTDFLLNSGAEIC
jgi:trehalose/maltose hydrolase-like predicted phosphorylase